MQRLAHLMHLRGRTIVSTPERDRFSITAVSQAVPVEPGDPLSTTLEEA
jgi:hypothetical protein